MRQWFYKLVFRMKPGELNLTTGYERIRKQVSATNSTWYFEIFKTLIKWAGFYYKKWKYFALFYSKSNFISIESWKSVKESRGSTNITNIKVLFFDLISKPYKSKGLYFIDSLDGLGAMALSNLLKVWLCENVNLVLLWISGCWEQDGNRC